MKVYEFKYNSDCCESAPSTISIHQTLKGAEMAMEFHKNETKRAHEELFDNEDEKEWDWDYDQWWGTKESELKE